MEEVTYMSDYLAAQMLVLAQEQECRFADCLESCEKTGDGFIKIDERSTFERLLNCRISSVLLSLASFEAYLGYYSAQTARRVEAEDPEISLLDYLEKLDLLLLFRDLPNRGKRRHEYIVAEHGRRPASRFLTSARLALEDKLLYWPLIRTGELVSTKDGNVKKLLKLINLREDLLAPAFETTHELRPALTQAEFMEAFLRHEAAKGLKPGTSRSDRYVVSPYYQEHFIWELLHSYPARVVQDAIQYLHLQAGDDQHYVSAIRQVRLVDDAGEPVTEPARKFAIEFDLEG